MHNTPLVSTGSGFLLQKVFCWSRSRDTCGSGGGRRTPFRAYSVASQNYERGFASVKRRTHTNVRGNEPCFSKPIGVIVIAQKIIARHWHWDSGVELLALRPLVASAYPSQSVSWEAQDEFDESNPLSQNASCRVELSLTPSQQRPTKGYLSPGTREGEEAYFHFSGMLPHAFQPVDRNAPLDGTSVLWDITYFQARYQASLVLNNACLRDGKGCVGLVLFNFSVGFNKMLTLAGLRLVAGWFRVGLYMVRLPWSWLQVGVGLGLNEQPMCLPVDMEPRSQQRSP